ncbi:PE-PGRS family protein PE_PGRS47 [Anopheles coustani]|uniref:PE-PGRS family protein PE_PGRS47 n=1 Tax=Anopheles coustani TaxID=139045 RepID=UPI0026593043|nr:PE-PGRS family protein PE_PGRS47 [Anopheles coustani]
MKFLVLCTLIAGTAAAYSNSVYQNGKASTGLYNQVPAGSDYADKFPHGSTGYNGGYTTHYTSPNGAGVAVGTGSFAGTPGFGGFGGPTVDFSNFFQGVQANFANLYQQQFALQQQLFAQQQAALNAGFAGFGGFGGAGAAAGGFPVYGPNFASGSYNRIPTGNFAGAPNVASSSASFGPGGFHQTASIYPNNPAVPNVDTRFGGSEETTFQSGKPGFVGVSSFSSSSNINGQTHREAVTSVNNNGKVTTHRVHS